MKQRMAAVLGSLEMTTEEIAALVLAYLSMLGCHFRSHTGQRWKPSLTQVPAGKVITWGGLRKLNKEIDF